MYKWENEEHNNKKGKTVENRFRQVKCHVIKAVWSPSLTLFRNEFRVVSTSN